MEHDMELTKKEAFRLGFLKRAAERGVTPTEAMEMVKQSNSNMWALLGGLGLLGVGVPAAVGVGTGTLHAELSDLEEDDIKQLKKKQLLQTLRSETGNIRNSIMKQNQKPYHQL
jgi:uncharacterized membrane protein